MIYWRMKTNGNRQDSYEGNTSRAIFIINVLELVALSLIDCDVMMRRL